MIPTNRDLEKSVRQALHDQAPKMYRELEAAGTLQTFSEEKAEEMLQEYDRAISPHRTRLAKSNLGFLERYQALTSAQHQIWESIMATYLEFPPDETTESEMEN